MKRRGFLGFMGGAVVAGPRAAKQVASQMLPAETLQLAGIGNALASGSLGSYYSQQPAGSGINAFDPGAHGLRALAKLAGLKSPRDRIRKQTDVYALDPDIMGYHSISLQAKISWQRERNIDRELDRKKFNWMQMAGLISDYDEDLGF